MTMIRPRSDVVYGIYRGLPSGCLLTSLVYGCRKCRSISNLALKEFFVLVFYLDTIVGLIRLRILWFPPIYVWATSQNHFYDNFHWGSLPRFSKSESSWYPNDHSFSTFWSSDLLKVTFLNIVTGSVFQVFIIEFYLQCRKFENVSMLTLMQLLLNGVHTTKTCHDHAGICLRIFSMVPENLSCTFSWVDTCALIYCNYLWFRQVGMYNKINDLTHCHLVC